MGAARMPLVLGNDFAGTVCAVGRGVKALREGDAVFGAKPPSSDGSHATHLVVRAEHVVLQPKGLPPTRLATLPYNFLTVSRALAGAGIAMENIRGRDVLVHGASGGLGLLAVRMLHSFGAHVTAIAGAGGHHACRAAGAAVVIDRQPGSLPRLTRRFAATLNFATWDDEEKLLRLLAPDAIGHATTVHPMLSNIDRLGLAYGAIASLRQKRAMSALVPRGARYAWTIFRPDRAALASLPELAAALQVPASVGFDLAETANAHRHVELRRPGRAVLLTGGLLT
jgi:NADPH:quinone reductase-like Zn-dependent oxidoreductase